MIYDTLNQKDYENNEYFKYYENEYDDYYPDDLGAKDAEVKANLYSKILTKKDFKSVVDIGCGEGSFLKEMIKLINVKKAVGTDISYFILKQAQKNNPDMDFFRSDSENLPFKNDEYELSTIIDVLEHVPNPEKMIQEARRVSKYVLIKVPMEDNLFINTYKRFVKTNWKDMMGHINFYHLESINKFMEDNGFELIRYEVSKATMVKQPNWKMYIMNICQCVVNIFPDNIRTKLCPADFCGIYEKKEK